MKNTLLTDLTRLFNYLECDGIKFSCHKCSNRVLCDLIVKLINSIKKYY